MKTVTVTCDKCGTKCEERYCTANIPIKDKVKRILNKSIGGNGTEEIQLCEKCFSEFEDVLKNAIYAWLEGETK